MQQTSIFELNDPAILAELFVQRTPKSKYNNRETVVDGITFDSAAEASRYRELKMLQFMGAIQDLKLQPEFVLQPSFKDFTGKRHRAIKYRADFQYRQDGKCIIEDVKGISTAAFSIKSKMFLYKYPEFDFRIVKVGKKRR